MADPVALQIQQPNALTTMSNMVGLAKNISTLQADIAQRKAESRRAEAEATVSEQTAQPRIESSRLELAQKHFGFNKDILEKADQSLASIAQDPSVLALQDPTTPDDQLKKHQERAHMLVERKRGYLEALLPQNAPADAAQKLDAVANMYHNVINTDPRGFAQHIAQQQQGRLSAGEQVAQNQVPAGNQQTIAQDTQGNQMVVRRDQFGRVIAPTAVPGSASPAPVTSLPPGDLAEAPALTEQRTSARNLLAAAPVSHYTNEGILKEIDNVAATGSAGPTIQGLMSRLGLAFGTAEEKASSYDLIGKFMERNALEAAKAMGPGTNAGLDAAIKANGSVAYNPTAIKRITKLNDAIVSGAEAYQPGLEKAIASNPQRGVLVKREYDQAWAQNFDPKVMEIFNASKRGDKKEIEDIVKSVGGKGSLGYEMLKRKAANIEKLSEQGHL